MILLCTILTILATVATVDSEITTYTNLNSFRDLLTLEEIYGVGGEAESGYISYTPYHTYGVSVGSERILEMTYAIDTSHAVMVVFDDNSIEFLTVPVNPTSWNPAISWFGMAVSPDDSREITALYLLPVSPTNLWGMKSYVGK